MWLGIKLLKIKVTVIINHYYLKIEGGCFSLYHFFFIDLLFLMRSKKYNNFEKRGKILEILKLQK